MTTNRMGVLATGLLLVAGITLSAVADAKLSKAGGGSAAFHASGPAGMAIDGKTSDVAVSEDGSNVVVVVTLSSLKTGMDLRDEHTKKALETDKFPTSELRVARGTLKIPDAGAEASGEARGTMKLHGKTKDVTIKYSAKRNGDVIEVKGKAHINMKEFGIEPPTYLGVGVKPDVDVDVSFNAKDG